MLLNILVFFILIISAICYIKIAEKYNIVDKPNHRSSHTVPTIRGGGVLFYLAIVIYFITSGYKYPYLFVGISLVAIISYVDDLISLSSKLRLLFQALAIGLVLYQVKTYIDIEYIVLIALFFIGIGFINFYNFMDGINAITGFYSLAVLTGFYVLNIDNSVVDDNLLYFLGLSLLVFGYFNFRKKARFFAGDIGSISIAVMFFFLTLFFYFKLKAPVVILLFLVYLTDAILTMFYRKYIGEDVMEAHRHHIYQKLTDLQKWSHLKTASYYALIQVFVNIFVYFTYKATILNQWLFVAIFIFLSIITYVLMFKFFKTKNG